MKEALAKIFNGKALCFPLFFVLVIGNLNAQEQMHRKIGEAGLGAGGSTYIGDLSPYFKLSFTRPAFNVFYRANIKDDHLVLRTNVATGSFYADESQLKDKLQQDRGLTFSSSFIEIAALLEYNFLDYRSSKEKQVGRSFSPFIFFGAAFMFPDGSNSEARLNPAIPYGVGLKFILSHHWNLGVEIGGRMTFTDDLDGYTNEDLNNTTKINDHYIVGGLTISYTFYSFDCPSTSPLLRK